MKQRIPSIIVAVYLLLCLCLGGSGQGVWTNLALQLLGIALIVWAAVVGPRSEEGASAAKLYVLLLAALLAILVQLIPLPSGLWTNLPGRSWLAEGYRLLGYDLPSLPISETPYQSVMALFAFIPAIAAFVVVQRLAPSPRWISAAIVGGMVLAIALGALQVASGPESWTDFYDVRNPGAVGFFANKNHMATLMLVGIPMAAALIASIRSDRRTSSVGKYGVGIALLVLVIVGIALNNSQAAVALSIPVILASSSLFPWAVRWRTAALFVSAVSLVAGAALLASNPIASNTSGAREPSSLDSRFEIWNTAATAIQDSFPAGTGLGSFQRVYHRYEDSQSVTNRYVNHAHNDYLQIVLELGAAGLLLIVLFLAWWGVTAARVWKSPLSSPFARAATIATAAVLVHSAVDFPLRTAAISAIFAACLGLMAHHLRAPQAAERSEQRQPRHVAIG